MTGFSKFFREVTIFSTNQILKLPGHFSPGRDLFVCKKYPEHLLLKNSQ